MADSLYHWLNNEIKLSKQIKDISIDFSNGFLFGELLSKFKLIATFDKFKDSNDKKDIINNYSLLETAFEELAIRLTDEIKRELILKAKNKTILFLYKIKQKIANKLISFDLIMAKGANKIYSVYSHDKNSSASLKGNNKKNKLQTKGLFLQRIQSASAQPVKYTNISLSKIDKGIIKEIVQEEKQLQEKQSDKTNIYQLDNRKLKEDKEKSYGSNWINQFEMKSESKLVKSTRDKIINGNAFKQTSNDYLISVKAFDENISKMGIDINSIDPKLSKPQIVDMSSNAIIEKIKQRIKIEESKKVNKERVLKRSDSALQQKSSSSFTRLRLQSSFNSIKKNNKEKKPESLRLNRTSSSAILPPLTAKQTNPNDGLTSVEEFNINYFFKGLQKENIDNRIKHTTLKNAKKEMNMLIIKPLVISLINLTEEYYEYQMNQTTELIALPQWKTLIQLFIQNKPLGSERINMLYMNKKNEKEKEDLTVNIEEMSNRNLLSFHQIKQDNQMLFSKNEEEKYMNYLSLIGEFRNEKLKEQISSSQLDIYDIMGNEIEILIQNNKDDKIDHDFVKSNKKTDVYHPRKEETEILQLTSVKPTDVFFGDLMREIIDYYHSNIKKDNSDNNNDINNASIKKNKLNLLFASIPIKIVLNGPMFSGKQTLAKMIEESFPKIKVYKLNDIITNLKEKIEMIELPSDHPKFRIMKKAQIDQYKIDMVQLEEQIKPFIPLIKKYISEGSNDEIMTDIILEQIKADFELIESQILINQIKARNDRKEELKEEFEKIKEEQVKKLKAKPKEEQQFKLELDQLNNEGYYGFILIDFPNNMNQAKLLEYKVNQYIPANELGKTTKQIEEEHLLISCQRTFEPKCILKKQSACNLFCFLSIQESEMLRRGLNRKIDSQTGIVYHLTDNPPPENDKKIKERLIDILEPTAEQIVSNSNVYIKKYEQMMNYYSNCLINRKLIITDNPKEESHIIIKENIADLVRKYEDVFLIHDTHVSDQLENSITNFNSIQPKAKLKFFEFKAKYPSITFQSIYNQWKTFINGYSYRIKSNLFSMQKSEDEFIKQLKRAEARFIQFLSKKSDKNTIITKFITKYITFCDKFDYIALNETVIQEFNKDLSHLTDQLWKYVTHEKHKAIKEIEEIKSSNIIVCMENFYLSIEHIIIAETEKLFVIINILTSFIDTKEDITSNINLLSELTKELSMFPLANNSNDNAFPKIERLYKNCFAILLKLSTKFKQFDNHLIKNQEEISIIKKRRFTSREFKGKPRDNVHLSEKDHDDDLKCSIQNNISCYKYQISALKYYAENRLKSIRNAGRILFNTMDQWIVLSVKKQNEAMNTLIDDLKKMISTSQLPNRKIELDDFRECYESITYHLQYKPAVFDDCYANEEFTFSIFCKVIDKMRQHSIVSNTITKFIFEELFFKGFVLNNQTRNLFSKKLQSKNFHDLATFEHHFISYSSNNNLGKNLDYIPEIIFQLNSIMTILFLLHCRKLSKEESEHMMEENANRLFKGSLMKKEDFLSLKLWFENDKKYLDTFLKETDNDKKKVYNKEIEIRKCLFEINKQNDEELDYSNFIQICLLNTLTSIKIKKEALKNIKKYEELFVL